MSQQIEQVETGDLPVYSKSVLPDHANVIVLVDEENYAIGGTLQAAYRLPLDRIVPTNTRQSVPYSLHANGDNGADIAIPSGEVIPAYVEAFNPFLVKRAQAATDTSLAQFLIISLNQNVDDEYIVQNTGFYTFEQPHNYGIGKLYYLSPSTTGGVTDAKPANYAQPLFRVVDEKTIAIEISAVAGG